jgi:hypothetical protein
MTSLRSQLVDQYLRPLGYQHGIYLVGKFDCMEHQCCPTRRTLEEVQADLEARAKAEEPDFRVVALVLDTSLPKSMMPNREAEKVKGA